MGKNGRRPRFCNPPAWKILGNKFSKGLLPEDPARKRERQEFEHDFREQAKAPQKAESSARRKAMAQKKKALRKKAKEEQRARLKSVGLSKKSWPKRVLQTASTRAAAPPLVPGSVPILPPNPWHFSLNSLAQPILEE